MKFNLPSDIEKYDFYTKKYRDYQGLIELKKITKRSINQNSYLHVCISIFAIELGYTLDEMKLVLKMECQFMHYEKKGKKFPKESRKLSTKELSEWIEWIRTKAGIEGIYIPPAEDYFRDWAKIESELEKFKPYL